MIFSMMPNIIVISCLTWKFLNVNFGLDVKWIKIFNKQNIVITTFTDTGNKIVKLPKKIDYSNDYSTSYRSFQLEKKVIQHQNWVRKKLISHIGAHSANDEKQKNNWKCRNNGNIDKCWSNFVSVITNEKYLVKLEVCLCLRKKNEYTSIDSYINSKSKQ